MGEPTCGGNCPHDSSEECAITWYRHYMSVSVEELARTLAARVTDDRDIGVALQKAAEARSDELQNL